MRHPALFALALLAAGCAHHVELVRGPGIPDPSLARDDSALGEVRYEAGGDRSEQSQRRSEAYLEMHDACAGVPDVVKESTDHGWHSLHFRCAAKPSPHPSDLPEDQKQCCWAMGLSCGNSVCTCDPNLCPQQ